MTAAQTAAPAAEPTVTQLREELLAWAETADRDELLEVVEAVKPTLIPDDATPQTVIGYVGDNAVSMSDLHDRLGSVDQAIAEGRTISIDEARTRLRAKRSNASS